MNKIVTTYLILVIQTMIAILSLNGKLTYGYGLGDVFYFSIYIGASIIISLIATILWRKKKNIRISNLLFAILLLLNVLQITLLRGTEMPWDGRILFNF